MLESVLVQLLVFSAQHPLHSKTTGNGKSARAAHKNKSTQVPGLMSTVEEIGTNKSTYLTKDVVQSDSNGLEEIRGSNQLLRGPVLGSPGLLPRFAWKDSTLNGFLLLFLV